VFEFDTDTITIPRPSQTQVFPPTAAAAGSSIFNVNSTSRLWTLGLGYIY